MPMNAIATTLSGIYPAHLVLPLVLLAAAVIDWRSNRIPNRLTLGGTVAALMISGLPSGVGPLDSILGALTALALLLPLYAIRVTGAGDVKLVAMVGAFLGLPDLLYALVFIVVAGGVCALAFALWHRRLARLALNVRDVLELSAIAALHGQRPSLANTASIGKLPYAICICIGTLAWLAWAHWRG
jgi:prepilin peptidase CpaA